MSKFTFKILSGTHSEDGKVYIAGTPNNIIETDRDLRLMFDGKFVTYEPRINAEEDPEIEYLEPIDKGRGKYDVIDTRTNRKINHAYLTKEQAFEWCGLPIMEETKRPERTEIKPEPETEGDEENDSDEIKDPLIG